MPLSTAAPELAHSPPPPPPPPWGVIADDLTGACDAAAPFAKAGFPAIVLLDRTGPDLARSGLAAISTESRDLSPVLSAERVAADCEWLHSRGVRVLYKKIDSVLRGNIVEEVGAVLRSVGFPEAILTPAFPAMGRMVRGGKLFVACQKDFAPIDLAERFSGLPLIRVADATSDAELTDIVEAAFRPGRAPLLVGSAGLAGALAVYLAGRFEIRHDPPAPPCCDAVLYVVGTPHPVTARQLDYLIGQREAVLRELAHLGSDAATVASSRLVVRVGWENPNASQCAPLARWLETHRRPGLFVSGGDTAAFVCEALGASAIELRGEAFPGIPWGMIRGGQAAGTVIVTKSGGFGEEAALVEIDDFLRGTAASAGRTERS